jgi:hypothetical protein
MSDTETVKERLIRDIVNFQIESREVGSGEEVSHDQVEEWEDDYRNTQLEELISIWRGNVGEWVSSMDRWYNRDEYFVEVENEEGVTEEVPVWEEEGFEGPADWQFEKLTETGEIDYGYQRFRYDHPYLPDE